MTRREAHREMVRARNEQLEATARILVFGLAYVGALIALGLFAERLF